MASSNRLTRALICSNFVHDNPARDFLRRLRVANLREPPHVTLCPRLQSQRRTLSRAEKELGQPMPRTQLILLGCLPLPHKIAQCLGVFIRNPHCRQISGTMTACQLQSIPPIRLHAVSGLLRNQARRNHRALDTQLRQLPVQYEACRTGFVAGSQTVRANQAS